MEAVPRFLIGSPSGEHLSIDSLRWEFPDATDFWDGNWVYASVTVKCGAFTGSYEALLRTDELASFRAQLAALYDNLSGHARFESMEHWLTLSIAGDGLGHFSADCVACDQPGIGNKLAFKLTFDQTELPGMLRELDESLRLFPVRGRR